MPQTPDNPLDNPIDELPNTDMINQNNHTNGFHTAPTFDPQIFATFAQNITNNPEVIMDILQYTSALLLQKGSLPNNPHTQQHTPTTKNNSNTTSSYTTGSSVTRTTYSSATHTTTGSSATNTTPYFCDACQTLNKPKTIKPPTEYVLHYTTKNASCCSETSNTNCDNHNALQQLPVGFMEMVSDWNDEVSLSRQTDVPLDTPLNSVHSTPPRKSNQKNHNQSYPSTPEKPQQNASGNKSCPITPPRIVNSDKLSSALRIPLGLWGKPVFNSALLDSTNIKNSSEDPFTDQPSSIKTPRATF